jgi:hypothetical protein
MAFLRTLSHLTFCLCAAPAAAQDSPVRLADFPGVVTQILESQKEGRISEMAPAQKQKMIDCVNQALAPMPNGRKRYILRGTSLEEREERFGTVLYENHAEWVQAIAHKCANIAMAGGRGRTTTPPGAQRP